MLDILCKLVLAVVVVGVIVVLSAIPKKSPLVRILADNNLYFPYHVVLVVYASLLGSYGLTLKDRSMANLMDSVQFIYGPAVDKHKKGLFADLTNFVTSNSNDNSVTQRKNKRPVVLEIGVGSGTNFQFYPKECDVIIVEPNEEMKEFYEANIKKYKGLSLVAQYNRGAEDLSGIDDNSVDAVVSTLVLCSLSDVEQTLREIHRVLKPGGKYYLLDHMSDPNANGKGGHSHGGGNGHSHGDGNGHSHGDGNGHNHGDGHGHSHGDGHGHSHGHSHGKGHSHGFFLDILDKLQRGNHLGGKKGSGCGGHGVEDRLKNAGFKDIQMTHVKLTYSQKSIICEKMANHRLGSATKP